MTVLIQKELCERRIPTLLREKGSMVVYYRMRCKADCRLTSTDFTENVDFNGALWNGKRRKVTQTQYSSIKPIVNRQERKKHSATLLCRPRKILEKSWLSSNLHVHEQNLLGKYYNSKLFILIHVYILDKTQSKDSEKTKNSKLSQI